MPYMRIDMHLIPDFFFLHTRQSQCPVPSAHLSAQAMPQGSDWRATIQRTHSASRLESGAELLSAGLLECALPHCCRRTLHQEAKGRWIGGTTLLCTHTRSADAGSRLAAARLDANSQVGQGIERHRARTATICPSVLVRQARQARAHAGRTGEEKRRGRAMCQR
jgi:hypothetical protein